MAGPGDATTRVTRGERARGRAFDLTWMGFESLRAVRSGSEGFLSEAGFAGPGEGPGSASGPSDRPRG
jgi:hypothetical protein